MASVIDLFSQVRKIEVLPKHSKVRLAGYAESRATWDRAINSNAWFFTPGDQFKFGQSIQIGAV